MWCETVDCAGFLRGGRGGLVIVRGRGDVGRGEGEREGGKMGGGRRGE